MVMISSLACIQAIRQVSGLEAQLKWPNDVLLHQKKVGGLLAEVGVQGHTLGYVVVGMGLNVNVSPGDLPILETPATSLSAELGRRVSRVQLLVNLLEGIEGGYLKMAEGWSPREEWRRHLVTLGQQVRARSSEEIIEGTAEDVDADGALLIRTGTGDLCRLLSGDVTLREGDGLGKNP
jgi:BirA family biotin operon repressor/biotin-[acetyl-CoA-carboxylase] ligase